MFMFCRHAWWHTYMPVSSPWGGFDGPIPPKQSSKTPKLKYETL